MKVKLNPLERNLAIFNSLLSHYGPRKWWPGRTRFEVIAGAILTQNVSWKNAKKAIDNLKKHGFLSSQAVYEAETAEIAEKIKSSRFYFQKAGKLKNFCRRLEEEYGGSLTELFRKDADALREELLSLKGIGPETADCILLYAGKKLSFVSDAYTGRFLNRYGILKDAGYEEIRAYFMENLPADIYIYNEFHALIVHHCNSVCRAKPDCAACPVRRINSDVWCVYAEGCSSRQKNKKDDQKF